MPVQRAPRRPVLMPAGTMPETARVRIVTPPAGTALAPSSGLPSGRRPLRERDSLNVTELVTDVKRQSERRGLPQFKRRIFTESVTSRLDFLHSDAGKRQFRHMRPKVRLSMRIPRLREMPNRFRLPQRSHYERRGTNLCICPR
jgi:hypothetical protein